MTKGHHHKRTPPSFYLGMAGTGLMLLRERAGDLRVEKLTRTSASTCRRAGRTGPSTPATTIWSSGGLSWVTPGNDYASIERDGFTARVFATSDGPEVVTGG